VGESKGDDTLLPEGQENAREGEFAALLRGVYQIEGGITMVETKYYECAVCGERTAARLNGVALCKLHRNADGLELAMLQERERMRARIAEIKAREKQEKQQ